MSDYDKLIEALNAAVEALDDELMGEHALSVKDAIKLIERTKQETKTSRSLADALSLVDSLKEVVDVLLVDDDTAELSDQVEGVIDFLKGNMTLNDFQIACLSTDAKRLNLDNIIEYLEDSNWHTEAELVETVQSLWELNYLAAGITGEAGEVLEKLKKYSRSVVLPDEEAKEKLALEVADVLWYSVVLLKYLGYDLELVARKLVAKLASRKERNQIKSVVGGDDR